MAPTNFLRIIFLLLYLPKFFRKYMDVPLILVPVCMDPINYETSVIYNRNNSNILVRGPIVLKWFKDS